MIYCTQDQHTTLQQHNTTTVAMPVWGDWSECDAACDGGSQSRQRICVGECDDPYYIVQKRVCNTKPCPCELQFISNIVF